MVFLLINQEFITIIIMCQSLDGDKHPMELNIGLFRIHMDLPGEKKATSRFLEGRTI